MSEFTKRARRVINETAQKEAKRMQNDTIGPEHILLGILQEEDSLAMRILRQMNTDFVALRSEIEKRSSSGDQILIDPLPDKYERVIQYAREEAKKLMHSYVGTEHILLALLRDNNNVAAASLIKYNISYSAVKTEIVRILGARSPGIWRRPLREKNTESRSNKLPVLEEHSRNLNAMAKSGKMIPVIGREKEIERIIQILCRKTKNNPILIGEAGVGKTAIVEGLAERIVNDQIPELLQEKTLVVLDLASLLAGTKYRGEFEDRLKRIIRELRNNPQIIVFIDELHTLIGAGAAEGAMDAANILKPALARGEIQCIGATTLVEYRKYVEKDSALERRFQSILVNEPSVDDTVRILQGIADSFGKHHRVKYDEDALELAARLAKRHIPDRFLPDKAIDIIDEAGASARLKNTEHPQDIKSLQSEIKSLVNKKEEHVRNQEYEKAANIRDVIASKRNILEERIQAWQDKNKKLFVSIGTNDIYKVMSLWTGVPLDKIKEGEGYRLLNLEKELHALIVGQEQAIVEVSRAVRRSRTGFKDQKRPSGSFIFVGPTGVGKTELARSLAKVLFGDEKKLYRLDMSEFMEMHSVSKLIGSPPGYVGYEDSGKLCEYIRRNPYSIILFDELEKAHTEILNILLQILDDGSLTDAHGRRVDFSETIIIMTSNIGSQKLFQRAFLGFSEDNQTAHETRNEKLLEELKKSLSPEFLNRIDEVITFQTLEETHVHKIIDILVQQMNDLFFEKKVKIELEDSAKAYLAERGFTKREGARSLRKVLQKEVIDHLSNEFLKGGLENPTEVRISAQLYQEKTDHHKKYRSLIFMNHEWKKYQQIRAQNKLELQENALEKKSLQSTTSTEKERPIAEQINSLPNESQSE